MLNHLSWSGNAEARDALERTAAPLLESSSDENRPIDRRDLPPPIDAMREAFDIASRCMTDGEIVACVERWIKDDKWSFVDAVERQHTTLADIRDALDRHESVAAPDLELSNAVKTGLRVSLARRLLTDDAEFVNKAKTFIGVGDYLSVLHRTIAPAGSHGKLGGKSSGLLLADAIIRSAPSVQTSSGRSAFLARTLTSDGILSFIEHNQLDDVHNHKYLDLEQIRRQVPAHRAGLPALDVPARACARLTLALESPGTCHWSCAARACSRTVSARRFRESTRACSWRTRAAKPSGCAA